MNIATRIFLIFFIFLGLLSAIVIFMSLLADSRQHSMEDRALHHYQFSLSNQLRQNSNDLTNMARTYVMTNDPLYERYYKELLSIKNGTLPRPFNYAGFDWANVASKKEITTGKGVTISFLDEMNKSLVTSEELDLIKNALTKSYELSEIDKAAISAMKGNFLDNNGQFSITRDPDPAYASQLLHSPEYHQKKAEVLKALLKFEGMLNQRIGQRISNHKSIENLYWNFTAFLVMGTILFTIYAFFHFRDRFIIPINALSNVASRILSGNIHERASLNFSDEIGALNNAFNKVIEDRVRVEKKLKNSEKNLRITLNSIGDALIATDTSGRVTRMNPIAERLTGCLISEAKGRPLEDVFRIIDTTNKKPTTNPVAKVLESGTISELERDTALISKDGTQYQIADSAAPIRNEVGVISGVVLVFRDISAEYAVQAKLHSSEERFKRLFENSEVAVCNEDLSEIKKTLEKIRETGVSDLRQYLKENKQLTWDLAKMVNILQVNKATLKLFKATSDSSFINQFDKTFGPETMNVFINGLCAIWDKEKVFRSLADFRTFDGKIINTIISYPIPETMDGFKSIPFSIIDVTELKNTENNLRDSEERFKLLFENAEVATYNEDLSEVYTALEDLRQLGVSDLRQYLNDHIDVAWSIADKVKVIQVNNATLKLFAANSGDYFIEKIGATFGPNAINVFIDELCAIWDKKTVFRSEADFQTLDGKTINAIISFQIPDTEEGFKCIPFSITDITDLKKAEIALKESEARLSLHLENTPLAVMAWDNDFNCNQWNPAAEEIFGFTREEAIGKQAIDLIAHDEFKGEVNKIADNLMNQTGGTHSINKNITKDGKTIICEWFNTPLIDHTGTTIGAASVVQDITQHKLVEDEIRKLSIVVEQSPASIIITDINGIIEYVNPKYVATTGYAPDEVIGQRCKIPVSMDTSEEDYDNLWHSITNAPHWRGELQNQRKDGSLFWELSTISPIKEKDGSITHFLVVKEDITERRQLEEHLRRAQKMDAIGQLAGGISHDFNNLLGIIIGNLDLIKRNLPKDEKLLNQLEKAQTAALRGSSLTRRLLNFSHQSPEASSPVNINKAIRSLEDLVGKSLTKKISIETNLADDLWMTEINSGDFEDMLINLSLNARDAMPDGGKIIIETRNTIIEHSITDFQHEMPPGDYIEVAISDTGTGMPKEVSAKIFDPFYTTKSKDKGTGLGLAMVYSFIQRSKGHISVYSEEGIGTTFRIYLPKSSSMAERMKKEPKAMAPLPRGNETILIVDDEEDLTFIAKSILESLGYNAICSYSADTALQKLAENDNIDLLFSDIVMAGSLNGFDLAKVALQSHPDLKILLTSGFTGKIEHSSILEEWGNTLITKPYRDAELATRIRETLDEGSKNDRP